MKSRISNVFGSPAGDDRKAFSLVELLVIVAVVAVLATIQVSALAAARGRTKVAMCSSNLRQLALALHLYAGENGNKLPVLSGSASWAWDIPSPIADTLLSYGLQKRNFYCPGTAPRFTDLENYQDPRSGNSLWNFGSSFRITGYAFALSGANSTLLISNRNTIVLAEPVRVSVSGSTLLPPPNAERVLLADATISAQRPNPGTYTTIQKLSYNYVQIGGGFYKPQVSPHLNGNVPQGGNLGFKDGLVAWRRFEDMDQRASSGIGFWW